MRTAHDTVPEEHPHFSYTVRKSRRAKQVRITVKKDGNVVVTLPHSAGFSIAQQAVTTKAQWIYRKIRQYAIRKNTRSGSLTKKDYLKYKEEARKLVHHRLEYFNTEYGFHYKNVSIRDQKTRWGSCSSKKNLNFNYKILFLTQEQQDYIIIHELCHLQELNHSPRFWKLVSRLVPNYNILRKEIRNMM